MYNNFALKIENVSKSYGNGRNKRLAINGISLTFPYGEWTSVIGKSGSGKTTLLRCASGLIRPDCGSVFLEDKNITAMSEDESAKMRRRQLGFIFQDYSLLDALTVRENISLPLLLDKKVKCEDVDAVLEEVHLVQYADSVAGSLSGGEKQRVAIARALVQKPAVLFADEPTGALDTVNTEIVLTLFRDLVERGIAVVMVTHDLDVASCGDRAIVLKDGCVTSIVSNPNPVILHDYLSA